MQVVQDLATFATVRYSTNLLPLKLILHQESGFSKKLISSPYFKVAPWGQTMQSCICSSIIVICLMVFISNTSLRRSSTTIIEWKMKVESLNYLTLELIRLLTKIRSTNKVIFVVSFKLQAKAVGCRFDIECKL